MIKQKLVIIDADGLVYHSSKETLEESIQVLNEKIQNIYDKTEATYSIFLISKGKYFRHAISNNSYKASRGKYTSSLKYLKSLKAYLEEEYNAQYMIGVEADDLCALYMARKWYYAKFTNPHSDSHWMLTDNIEGCNESLEIDVVLAAVDKDLLKSIVGTHFNYSYRLEDKTKPESVEKGWWVTTGKRDAEIFQWTQMLMGDATDGITGIPGIGIKGAEKIILECELAGKYLPEYILSRYVSHYHSVSKGVYEFQKNYRLLHLLNTDADFIQETGELPKFPIINKIKPIEIITAEYI